jgi:hypothetical protein
MYRKVSTGLSCVMVPDVNCRKQGTKPTCTLKQTGIFFSNEATITFSRKDLLNYVNSDC